ncbi:MAG: toluene tolerance protein [Gammaproteobacteria bacterium]
METPEGNILKIFITENILKRWFYPKSKRFITLAQHLTQRGIHTIEPNAYYYYPEKHYEIIIYPKLAGTNLHQAAQQQPEVLLPLLAHYLAQLHHKNIYFRGGHLGNILLTPDNQFALIDIGNMRLQISDRQRLKNIDYITGYPDDAELFTNFGIEKFIEIYQAHYQALAKKLHQPNHSI